MSSSQLRIKVLSAFKELHRARLQAFQGDARALFAARKEINNNFLKNKHITDESKIEELVVVATDAANILRKHVLQLEQIEENRYRANLTKDTYLIENTIFQDTPEEELLKHKTRKTKNTKTENK